MHCSWLARIGIGKPGTAWFQLKCAPSGAGEVGPWSVLKRGKIWFSALLRDVAVPEIFSRVIFVYALFSPDIKEDGRLSVL